MSPPDTTAPFYGPVKELYRRIKAAGYPVTWPHGNDARREPFTGTIPGIQARLSRWRLGRANRYLA